LVYRYIFHNVLLDSCLFTASFNSSTFNNKSQ
jgi:hypothetical protein